MRKPSGLFSTHSTLYTRPPKTISKEAEWHEKRETLKGSGRYVHVEQIKLTLFGMNHNRPRNRFPHVYHDRVAARINGMLSRSGSAYGNVQRGVIIRVKNLLHGGVGICGSFVAEEPDLNLALAERRVNDELLSIGHGNARAAASADSRFVCRDKDRVAVIIRHDLQAWLAVFCHATSQY